MDANPVAAAASVGDESVSADGDIAMADDSVASLDDLVNLAKLAVDEAEAEASASMGEVEIDRLTGANRFGCPFGGHKYPSAESDPSQWEDKSADQQLDDLWQRLLDAQLPPGQRPVYPALSSLHKELMGTQSYAKLLQSRDDHRLGTKSLCSVGAVARARFEWSEGAAGKYTGLFSGTGTGEGILRLSTACEPPGTSSSLPGPVRASLRVFGGDLGSARLFPCAAFKAPRDGAPSGNLVFAGRKVGQASSSFFASHIATTVTEKSAVFLKPFLEAFRKYSQYPTQIGLSDFAAAARTGCKEVNPVFPWALVLRPTAAAMRFADEAWMPSGSESLETFFLRELALVPAGTPLYEVYAVPSPSAALDGGSGSDQIHRLGRLVTSSAFIRSDADGALRFWHQRREEDYTVRPDWEQQLTAAHKNDCGAEHFARLMGGGKSGHARSA